MRTMTLAASLLVALSMGGAASAASAVEPLGLSPGPFAGALLPDESAVHHYQNAPDGSVCVALAAPYTVAIESTGPVRVSVDTYAATVDGTGSISFWRGVCTQFDIEVVSLADVPVAYAIEVVRSAPDLGVAIAPA